MCKHAFIKFNEVSVCVHCGLTLTHDGKVLFDRDFPNMKRKKRRKK